MRTKRPLPAVPPVPSKRPRRAELSPQEAVAHAWVGASEAGDLSMLNILLPVVELGPGVNCTDSLGVTALRAALETGKLEVVDWLLLHKDINLDFRAQDKLGRTALDCVLLSPSAYFLDMILDVFASDLEETQLSRLLNPRLEVCLKTGRLDHFNKILPYYNNVNFKQKDMEDLLTMLIKEASVKFISAVLDCYEEDIEVKSHHNQAFLVALRRGKTQIIKPLYFFFKHQIKEVFNCVGFSSSHRRVQTEVFKILTKDSVSLRENIKPGLECVDVNMQDSNGDTLLIHAVRSNCVQTIQTILEVSPLDVNHMNMAGMSALDFLLMRPHGIAMSLRGTGPATGLHASLLPAMNRITMKPLALNSARVDLRVAFLFFLRQRLHKDVDFNFTQQPLLVRALQLDKLDLARLLLTHCSYKVTASELAAAGRALASGQVHPVERRGLQVLLARLGREELGLEIEENTEDVQQDRLLVSHPGRAKLGGEEKAGSPVRSNRSGFFGPRRPREAGGGMACASCGREVHGGRFVEHVLHYHATDQDPPTSPVFPRSPFFNSPVFQRRRGN